MDEIHSDIIQMKATEQHFAVLLFSMLYKVVLPLGCECDYSNAIMIEKCFAVELFPF